MSCARPDFLDSPYVEAAEGGGWRLKEGAPTKIVRAFRAWQRAHEEEIPPPSYEPQLLDLNRANRLG